MATVRKCCAESLGNVNEFRLEAYNTELESSVERCASENDRAIQALYDTYSLGMTEWARAEEKLYARYNSWRRDFFKRYEKETCEWEDNYEDFLEEKQLLVTAFYMDAVAETAVTKADTDSTFKNGKLTEKDTDAMLLAARKSARKKIERTEIDASAIVDSLLEGTSLERTAEKLGGIKDRINSNHIVIKKAPRAESRTESLYSAMNAMSEARKGMEEAASKLAAQEAAKNLEEMRKSYENAVPEANEQVDATIRDMAESKGYMWNRGGYTAPCGR